MEQAFSLLSLSPAEHLHLPVVGLMVWQVDQSPLHIKKARRAVGLGGPLREKIKETPLDAGLF
jgi:hypothetical protein